MKTIQNIKKYVVWFTVWIALVSGVTYAASSGSIWNMFTENGSNWLLKPIAIGEWSITNGKLAGGITTDKIVSLVSTKITWVLAVAQIPSLPISKIDTLSTTLNAKANLSGWNTFSGVNTFAQVRGTEFTYTSDERYKDNIETIQNPLETVQALRWVTWDWKSNGKSDVWFIAQEVEEVLPQLVSTDENGYKWVQYWNLVWVLVEAVKQQQKQIDQLQAQIDALEAR